MFALFFYCFLSICWFSSRAGCWARCILGADPLQSSLCPAFHTRLCLPLGQSTLNVARGVWCCCPSPFPTQPPASQRHSCLVAFQPEHTAVIFSLKTLPPRPASRCIPFSFRSQSESLCRPATSEHRPLLMGYPYCGRQSRDLCGCRWEP